MESIVYVFTNPGMPGLVKIGKTANLNRRLQDLSKPTGVPGRFECQYAVQTDSAAKAVKIEKLLFDTFAPYRKQGREFFEVECERAVAALQIAETMGARKITLDGFTTTDQETETGKPEITEQQSSARNMLPFRFSMVGIDVGATLTLSESPYTSAIVTKASPQPVPRIRCSGMTTDESLTGAAKRILKLSSPPRGPTCWIFDDPVHGKETLAERRRRMKKKE